MTDNLARAVAFFAAGTMPTGWPASFPAWFAIADLITTGCLLVTSGYYMARWIKQW